MHTTMHSVHVKCFRVYMEMYILHVTVLKKSMRITYAWATAYKYMYLCTCVCVQKNDNLYQCTYVCVHVYLYKWLRTMATRVRRRDVTWRLCCCGWPVDGRQSPLHDCWSRASIGWTDRDAEVPGGSLVAQHWMCVQLEWFGN